MIIVKNLTKTYNKGKSNQFNAIENITFSVDDNELVAIVGTSGAGKSTLLHIVSTIDNATSGEVEIDGCDITKISNAKRAEMRNKQIGLVIQDYALINDYNVLENVMLPLTFSKVKNKKEKALSALSDIGIEHLAKKKISKLSGGEKQRVAIARAIVNNPKYIFADEPTGNLDSVTTEGIIDLFQTLNKKGKTIIIITHDMNVANKCHRIIRLADGKIVSFKSNDSDEIL